MAAVCEHGAASHDGTESSMASAPEASRAWLLVEHPGPWPHEPTEAVLPAPLDAVVASAAELGVRVQLIRSPRAAGRGRAGNARGGFTVLAGWVAGSEPWLRRGSVTGGEGWPDGLDLERLAAGESVTFGSPVSEPVFLVCGHAQRNACCARFGGPLAVELAARYPGQVFQTTHVGGHRFAANLVILPHGLYYGPVSVELATAAISAYERGAVEVGRFRGRAGQPRSVQEAEYEILARNGGLPVSALA
ncbi:MAG: sucrase ferredoxin [Streptosporangiaceae bacterium]